MWIDPEQLKSFLLDAGLVTKEALAKASAEAEEKKTTLEAILVKNGVISEDDFRRAKAYILGIPFVDLKKEKISREILFLIPEPIARKHNIVAFQKNEKGLEVAMLDPEDLEAIDFIKKGVGLKILPRLTDVGSIKNLLLQYQKSLKAEFGDIVEQEALKLKASAEESAEEPDAGKLQKLAADLPVVRIVDALLSHAILQRASDIHIESFETEVVVRYRIDGILHDAMMLPKNVAAGIVARIKVLSNLRLDEKRLPQDGRFKTETADQKVSFRVSILPTYYGEKVVMRLLPETSHGLTLEQGGLHGENLERIQSAMHQATGMILVTGPTGSGKTTTLYTLMAILNTPNVNISTIEDPIEYQMPRINQTQVKPEIGLTFANGLRALVRQDPDIVMVGEIRDKETASLAINAALTGHLVLSTLHTNSAAGAVPRLLDMGAESFLLVSTINVIVAQRLVRQLDQAKEKYFLSPAETKKLEALVDLERILDWLKQEKIVEPKTTWKEIPFYKPKPSLESEDGYHGRIGIHEVLPISLAIKELIMKGATSGAIERQAKSEGMMTMLEDGVFKAVQGITTLEEVLRVVTE
ncbi:MAG: type II/IV secretion system protein [Candidatus Vogelbacteria bacterium]|nr:type II/IV secretion system protein [Candidatus Vogelbacteria bacterium]